MFNVKWEVVTACGLFALAFTASLCMRKDPHTEHYAQMEMRQHLARYFEEKKMTSFPKTPMKEGGLEDTELYIQRRSMSSVYTYALSPGAGTMENVDPWCNALDARSGITRSA